MVEYCRQEVARGAKVLVCAPSNVAVDNLVQRLVSPRPKGGSLNVVRLGHPARLLPEVQTGLLELKVPLLTPP